MRSLRRRVQTILLIGALGGCGPVQGNLHPPADATGDDGRPTPQIDAGTNSNRDGGHVFVEDPRTCTEASWSHSYVGCDFWPTVLPNYVGEHFDYAVVVANAGDGTAHVTIERGASVVAEGDVPPSGLRKFFLPWVDELKQWTGMCDTDNTTVGPFESRRVPGGAYHLVSTRPVTVYQFNPLEYGPQGGPPDKDWSACNACMFGCNSYTNDAALLLPSTAATGNYRITVPAGQNTEDVTQPGYLAIVGVGTGEFQTQVSVRVGPNGAITGGGDIPSAGPGEVIDFNIDVGEVVLIVGTPTSDLAGSLVVASNPIQVLSGAPCHYMPDEYGSCDHMEESVFPAETFGTRYFITVPTNPRGVPVGHVVRLYGNADQTHLDYPGGAPAGAPGTLDEGQVVDLGIVDVDFEVTGDKEFGVTSFQLGSSIGDPGHVTDHEGDPAQSNVVSVEQYRKKYVFLAPDDYDFSFADIVMPMDANVLLDSNPISVAPTLISSGFGVARIELGPGAGGAHVLEADQPVSLQVVGYGYATSYQYPGGLNLSQISDPPVL